MTIEVANTNAIPAHGLVRISSAGQSHIRRNFPRLPAKQSACRCPPKPLPVWSCKIGTAPNNAPSAARRPGRCEVANVSASTLAGVPVVVEAPQPVAAWLRQLAPGQTETLQPPGNGWTKPSRLELQADGVTWSGSCKDGNLFDHVQAGDLALGRLVFAIHQQIDGREEWTECDRIVSLQLQEQPDAWLVEAVVGYGELPALRTASTRRCGWPFSNTAVLCSPGLCGWRIPGLEIGNWPKSIGSAVHPWVARLRTTWPEARECPTIIATRNSGPIPSRAAALARWIPALAGW